MEVFIHRDSTTEIHLHQLDPAETVKAVAQRYGPENGSVWLQGSNDPLPAGQALMEVGIGEHGHLHIGTCKRVAVSVRYGGDAKSKEFPPAEVFEAVFQWATGPEGFGLTPDQKAKHTLGICDSLIEPDRGTHVGSAATDCSLCLDLAPKERFQG
jgi:hypothetical protein